MQTLIDLARPKPEAKWVVFYSLSDAPDGGIYYDVDAIEQMSYKLTMLAYDMNGKPLPFLFGAPLRLRNETELGFRQVKWSRAWNSSPTSPTSAAATADTTKTMSSSDTDNPSKG